MAEKRYVPPYSRLAGIYDYVMRHVDYVHWADYAESVALRHGFHPRKVVDLACGTGSLALELSARGYRVEGSDGCEAMLAVARKKAREAGHDVRFHCLDLRDLHSLGRFDWAICLYDSVNYLMSIDAIEEMLAEVHGVVEPGGLFLFDVCTESNSMRYFRDMREKEQGEGFAYSRHSYYREGIQYNEFEIRFQNPRERVCERHQQRIYPLSTIEGAARRSPFRMEAAYEGFGFQPPSERSDRVHFVLRA